METPPQDREREKPAEEPGELREEDVTRGDRLDDGDTRESEQLPGDED